MQKTFMQFIPWMIKCVKNSLWKSHAGYLLNDTQVNWLIMIESKQNWRIINVIYNIENSQHVESIQIKHWKSFVLFCLCFVLKKKKYLLLKKYEGIPCLKKLQ